MKWLVALLTLCWPSVVFADGFVAAPGTLWVKTDATVWRSDSKFAGIFDRNPGSVELGDRIPFDSSTGGELRSLSFALTALYVPVDPLEIGLYVPVWQRVVFEDDTFIGESTGVGDVRPSVAVRLTPRDIDVGTKLALDLKIPTSPLPTGFESIPLSEGQFDIAVRHETTWAPHPRLALTAMTLFRRRTVFVDGDRRIKPGDEAEVSAVVGGALVPHVWTSVGVHGLWSTGSEDRSGSGAVTLRDRRQVQHAVGGIYVAFGRWLPILTGVALDLGLRLPLHGQDYPAGPTFSGGLAYEVDLH